MYETQMNGLAKVLTERGLFVAVAENGYLTVTHKERGAAYCTVRPEKYRHSDDIELLIEGLSAKGRPVYQNLFPDARRPDKMWTTAMWEVIEALGYPDGSVKVGDGATHCCGSDAYPYSVVDVSHGGKTLIVRRDTATRTDHNGQSESQTYDITPWADGPTEVIRLAKNGRFYGKGGMANGSVFGVGWRRAYDDPSF